MKNLRGVCAAGWGEPCPALRDASETSTNRGNALGRGESSPQLEMGTAHFLVFEPLGKSQLPRTGARSPSGNSRGGCLGCIPLDPTQYDMMNEGTEYLYLGPCRIPNLAEFQKHSAEEKRNPYPQNFCFRFSESA